MSLSKESLYTNVYTEMEAERGRRQKEEEGKQILAFEDFERYIGILYTISTFLKSEIMSKQKVKRKNVDLANDLSDCTFTQGADYIDQKLQDTLTVLLANIIFKRQQMLQGILKTSSKETTTLELFSIFLFLNLIFHGHKFLPRGETKYNICF